MIKKDDVLYFENLSQFSHLVHGFSTRAFGDLHYHHDQYVHAIQQFSQGLSISSDHLIRMNQVHSASVVEVTDADWGFVIPETDGLITDTLRVFLGVVTADCLPILFYDPKKRIVAAVHAGWRGLYAEIIKETVLQMKEKGSDPQDIVVGIGPSIRICCYEVNKKFVDKFYKKFDSFEQFVEIRHGKFFFDLQNVAIQQLVQAGISSKNIEDGNYCTFDNTDVYSCRREGKPFGEIMGIIGLVQ